MGDFAVTECTDKMMVDLAIVVEPEVNNDSEGEGEV
jgi:hypothetical protein